MNASGAADVLAGGRYELGELLGAGGMGLVRRARDTVLDRDVAVKLLADNLAADADARERFLREARAAARVTDPHVVTVHDVGEEAGRPYLVMELVDGPSLADVLRRDGPLDPYDVVEVAAQALAGLAAAHAAGVLHRDVKPGNLLCGPDGAVKVADFGVAEAADVPGLTRTGFVLGTRSYLAPERLRGAPASVRTDLYALGATLVELLTGSPPSDTPARDVAGLPVGLGRLLTRLTADDPEARPRSAEDALLEWAESGPLAAAEAVDAVADDTTVDLRAVAPTPAGPPPRRKTTTPREPRETTALLPAGAAADTPVAPLDAAPDATAPAPGAPGGGSRAWRLVALLGLAVLAVVVLLQLVDGGADTPPPEPGGGEDVEATDDDPAADDDPAEENPADAARDLARWLRERADD
ncbi:serine/threonine-protein kinase [Egicoccus sp. AB-alg2]|uniref:serine/threonine-protein kinase n=1 Tax=Egicoccus sp. AB-alg2 TaxID=3242693 RepID=UPI00359E97E5